MRHYFSLRNHVAIVSRPKHRKRQPLGFTIVELLIVIVVIGILAALVIIAYSNIQQRARNASRIASVKELQKILALYVAQEGKYPYASYGCMGSGYTDWDGDGTLDCYAKNTNRQHPNTTLNNELQKIAPLPKVNTDDVPGTSENYRGYLYYPNVTIDGKAGRVMIVYWLEGLNQNCSIAGVLTPIAGGYGLNGATSSNGNYGGTTACYIAAVEP